VFDVVILILTVATYFYENVFIVFVFYYATLKNKINNLDVKLLKFISSPYAYFCQG